MKKFFVILFLIAASCFSMKAQVATTGGFLDFRSGNFYQNGRKLTPEQLCATIGQQAYDDQYTVAKKFRTAGTICLGAGGVATAAGIGMTAWGISEKNSTTETINGIPLIYWGVTTSTVGVATMIVGGVLLGNGNKKMRNLARSFNNGGITVNF